MLESFKSGNADNDEGSDVTTSYDSENDVSYVSFESDEDYENEDNDGIKIDFEPVLKKWLETEDMPKDEPQKWLPQLIATSIKGGHQKLQQWLHWEYSAECNQIDHPQIVHELTKCLTGLQLNCQTQLEILEKYINHIPITDDGVRDSLLSSAISLGLPNIVHNLLHPSQDSQKQVEFDGAASGSHLNNCLDILLGTLPKENKEAYEQHAQDGKLIDLQNRIAQSLLHLAQAPGLSLTKAQQRGGDEANASVVFKIYTLLYAHKGLQDETKATLKKALHALLPKDYFYKYTPPIETSKKPSPKDKAITYHGNTLMFAALQGNREIFEELEASACEEQIFKIAPSSGQETSYNPLIAACSTEHSKIAQHILDKWKPTGSKINLQDSSGRSALWYSYASGDQKLINALTHRGATCQDEQSKTKGYNMLMAACYSTNLERVKEVLPLCNPHTHDPEGNTALHYLLSSPNIINKNMDSSAAEAYSIIKLLLDEGHNPNAVNKQGMTPLMYAARSGRLDIVKALLEAPNYLELNEQDIDGKTALIYAVETGKEPIIALLLNDPRVNPRIVDNRGFDALTTLLALNTPENTLKTQSSSSIDEAAAPMASAWWQTLHSWMQGAKGWLHTTFVESYELKPKSIDTVWIKDEGTLRLAAQFLERGADPGSSYMYNGSDAAIALGVSGFMHFIVPKLVALTKILPEGVAKHIAWYLNARYCVRPAVENMVRNIASNWFGTAKNVPTLLKTTTEIGIYHLNWQGIPQYKEITEEERTAVGQKFKASPLKMYKCLTSRYMCIQRDKYNLNYDGRWWNLPFKILTWPWRFYKLTILQEQIIELMHNNISFSGISTEGKSGAIRFDKEHGRDEFVRCLERGLVDDSLMEKMSKDGQFKSFLQKIIKYEVAVGPDVYDLVWQFNNAIHTQFYKRRYGILEDLKVTCMQAFMLLTESINDTAAIEIIDGQSFSGTALGKRVLAFQNKTESLWKRKVPCNTPTEEAETANLTSGTVEQAHHTNLSTWLEGYKDPNWLGHIAGIAGMGIYQTYTLATDMGRIKQAAGMVATGLISCFPGMALAGAAGIVGAAYYRYSNTAKDKQPEIPEEDPAVQQLRQILEEVSSELSAAPGSRDDWQRQVLQGRQNTSSMPLSTDSSVS